MLETVGVGSSPGCGHDNGANGRAPLNRSELKTSVHTAKGRLLVIGQFAKQGGGDKETTRWPRWQAVRPEVRAMKVLPRKCGSASEEIWFEVCRPNVLLSPHERYHPQHDGSCGSLAYSTVPGGARVLSTAIFPGLRRGPPAGCRVRISFGNRR